MRGLYFDRILAGSALTLVLALSGPAVGQSVSPEEKAAVESRIPDNATAGTAAKDQPTAESATPQSDTTASTPPSATPSPAPAVDAAKPAETAPSVTVANNPFGDKLKEAFSGRGADRYFTRRNERTAAETFYRDRNYAPLWVENGKTSSRGDAAVAYLQRVDADGLEPSDYPAPNFKTGDDIALAEAELRLTGEIMEFARHASMGRVHYSRISNDIGFDQDAPDPAELLGKLANAPDLKAALDSYQPQHAQYKLLKAKLAEARGQTQVTEEIVRIPDGGKVKANADDPRVPLLRKRLKIEGDADSLRYDQTVIDAVKTFQKSAGLNADGMIGPGTLRALNGVQKRERSADIISVNMDRWRWMPRDLGKNHVMVNIPDYKLKIVRDNKLYWDTKIVVGKPSQATPIMTSPMKFITVNPTWNVPPSIIANEYLPAVRQDPGALARMGLKMEQNRDGTVRIYQPPGDRNALGRIRFNFPNKFLVYQHDTPDKHLFAHDKRAYSHGCMRVENPLMYGEKLLSVMLPNEGYTQDKLKRMYGPAEVNINFPTTLPVHLTYQTAFVDDAGQLQIRDDIYGRDARHIAASKGEERKVADIATPRAPTGSGISQDALRYQTREAGPFADWFDSRRDRRGAQVSGRNDPVGDFFGRLFR